MLEIMFDVTRNIVVLVIVFSLLEMFLPRGEFRPFLNMVIGLVLMLTLLGPFWALRQLPEAPALVLEERQEWQPDKEIRLSGLEQLNQGLTLLRYRELLAGKIAEVLRGEGFQPVEHTLEMVEAPGHPAYGQLLGVRVLAVATATAAPVRKAPEIPEIRVRIGEMEAARQWEDSEEAWTAGVPDGRLASLLAQSLGLAEEKITVRVLKD